MVLTIDLKLLGDKLLLLLGQMAYLFFKSLILLLQCCDFECFFLQSLFLFQKLSVYAVVFGDFKDSIFVFKPLDFVFHVSDHLLVDGKS